MAGDTLVAIGWRTRFRDFWESLTTEEREDFFKTVDEVNDKIVQRRNRKKGAWSKECNGNQD